MRKIFLILMCFSFSLNIQATQPEKPKPIPEMTFLISRIDDGDAFYRDLFSGFKKFRDEGYIKTLNIINYEGSEEKLEQEFNKAIKTSDAISMDLLDVKTAKKFVGPAAAKGIPLIFTFVKPSEKILNTYPNIFYISQDELQSGVTQGILVSQYIHDHPETDKNKDQVINILNVAGLGYDIGDEWRRFKWQINTINNYPGNKIKANEIDNFAAFFNKDKAYQYIKKLIAENKEINDVEIIVAQSDNMAQGVVEALEGTPYQNIPIVSRGRTAIGDNYILNNKIVGTIQSPPELVGYYAARLAYNYYNHLPINANIPYLVYKKKIELPYNIITKKDLKK